MFERVILDWSSVIAGSMDFVEVEDKIAHCVGEMIKHVAESGSAEWLANGEVGDPVAAIESISKEAYLEVKSHGDADTQEEFNRVVIGVRDLLMSKMPQIESAARSIAKTEFA